MSILTHTRIDQDFCGTPLDVGEGFSRVQLRTNQRMAVDESGLLHGGFIFGLADYSAMIAVNHPNVVLGAADVKFAKPVKAGEVIVAEANVKRQEGKKYEVYSTVKRGDTRIFEGRFVCFVLDKHVFS
jgi:uncharacterized protein (TIGR00369 family)